MIKNETPQKVIQEIASIDKCDKCNSELELCPADWPWNPDYWICVKCDSTFILNT
jgi:hypothetical protein